MPMSSPQITTMFGLSALDLDLAISISFRWSGGFESAYGLQCPTANGYRNLNRSPPRKRGPGLPLARNKGANAEPLGSLDSRVRGNDKHPFSVSVSIARHTRLRKAEQHGKEGEDADADEQNGNRNNRRLHPVSFHSGDWRERLAPHITKCPEVLPKRNHER